MQFLNFVFKLFSSCSSELFQKITHSKIYVMLYIARHFYVNIRYFILSFPHKY